MHKQKSLVLMGNEAIAYGALTAGVGVVSGYPGTPSSEVIDTLLELARMGEIKKTYVEWAINERVAFEVCLGAALVGARSLVTMKAPGINVASDPLISSAYSGIESGMLILVADDPGPHTTQTEQDSRWYGDLAKLPMIEPSSPQEAYEYTILGYEISEKLKLPIILRTTTRVNHVVGNVVIREFKEPDYKPFFKKNPKRYLRAVMTWNRERHEELLETLYKVEPIAEEVGLNKIEGSGDIGIICSGAAYNYVMEVLDENHILDDYKILKLGLIYPLPKKKIEEFLRTVKKVIVVEEIDPYLESKIKELAYDLQLDIEIQGRRELFKKSGELTPDDVENALLGRPILGDISLPRRPPPLCPGCPHMGTYMGLRAGISRAGHRWGEVPVMGDIGCYALGLNPPFEAIWTEHSMGASISMAMGMKVAGYEKPVVAVIGDSTFYHSGITSLIEAVNKNVNILVVIMDNSTVAMTGHQSTPGYSISISGRKLNPVNLESIVKSLGIENVAVVNAFEHREVAEKVREYLKMDGVKVIISRGDCAVLRRRSGIEQVCWVDLEKCTGCLACVKLTGCPALTQVDNKISILEAECTGCTLCMQVCPYDAIIIKKLRET
ncbi:MAG: indolepyruvate ferredoxin oxidoreductase subunit alpha [Nitrososphaerota archaeon]|nr:indolepyruvate ferredoxin oxidoreductase subunit alpha [Nitrososphaerota archaeon]